MFTQYLTLRDKDGISDEKLNAMSSKGWRVHSVDFAANEDGKDVIRQALLTQDHENVVPITQSERQPKVHSMNIARAAPMLN